MLIVLLLLAINLHAEGPATPIKKEPAQAPKTSATPKVVSPKAITSTTISEVVAQNITVPAGAIQQYFAQSDYSGADKVNIAIYATPDQDLSMTVYQVWWAIPTALNYVLADVIQGKNFNYLNTGGASLPPYGNELLIYVVNNGAQPVTITQITAYAVAR